MELDEILKSLKSGDIETAEAEKLLSLYSIEKVGEFAKIDIDRQKRRGIPEVVFAQGKKLQDTKDIVRTIMSKNDTALVSRISEGDHSSMVSFAIESGWTAIRGRNSTSILIRKGEKRTVGGIVGIVAAGTSDIGVAEEARLMCESMGVECRTMYDVGVAGMQRVLESMRDITDADADAIIVAAGMEGALATIVSSLTSIPVIGVPTSVGYGYGGGGIAALASMLQSCALGVTVVNIDNGIGAGAAAASIARRAHRRRAGGDASN